VKKSKSYEILKKTGNALALRFALNSVMNGLRPIDYTRTKEIPALLDISGILERGDQPLRMLDIGSPQILSLSLSTVSKSWDITYINSYDVELNDLSLKAKCLGLRNISIKSANITDFDSIQNLGKFDYIFSCSVFEHIYPEDGGDIIASRNIRSLLKDGGIFAFSVPFYKEAFNEYKYGDIYAHKGSEEKKMFFQRFYDEESLFNQIIKPSGLSVVDKRYLGERYYYTNNIKKRISLLFSSGITSLLLGRFFSFLSSIFMEESSSYADLKKPYIATYTLKR